MKLYLFIIVIIVCWANDIPKFDGNRAKDLIIKQCDFGPRYPNSKGHTNMKKFFEKFLKPISDTLYVMNETISHPHKKYDVILTNYLARFNQKANYRIMLMAHWDTREYADKDLNSKNHLLPILGANDGGSGVSILLTLAEIINKNPINNIGIDFLFVDGEDMGKYGDPDSWGLGTQAFAKKIPAPKPKFAVCIDMVADYDQHFPIEYFSLIQAPEIVNSIWSLANELGYSQFENKVGKAIMDDHYYLYKYAKIPAIDIIDFDYPNQHENFWHTINDTPENCSAKSLEAVGTVMTHFIYTKNKEFE